MPFKDDKLKRLETAKNFKQVLLNNDNSSVFTVNASWGHGKTYFIDNLIKLIGNEAVCIKYNAWESDFYENPLIPLCSEISSFIEDKFKNDQGIIDEARKIKKALKGLTLKPAINLVVASIGVEKNDEDDVCDA